MAVGRKAREAPCLCEAGWELPGRLGDETLSLCVVSCLCGAGLASFRLIWTGGPFSHLLPRFFVFTMLKTYLGIKCC